MCVLRSIHFMIHGQALKINKSGTVVILVLYKLRVQNQYRLLHTEFTATLGYIEGSHLKQQQGKKPGVGSRSHFPRTVRGSEVQCHPWLYSESKTSLGHSQPSLNK